MKKLLILLLCPLFTSAQQSLPRFDNDTLYTTSGYTIYKGQILHLASGTSEAGYFKFIKFHPNQAKTNTYSLQNSTILVTKLKGYKNSKTDENTIRVFGKVTYKDGKQEDVDIIMNFERAIENFAGLSPELTVPDEYKNKRTETVISGTKNQTIVAENKTVQSADEIKKESIADEIRKLFALYKEGAITKEEYESLKKKLMEKQ